MKPSLVLEAKTLISMLPKGGRKEFAARMGWTKNLGRVSDLANGREPRCAGGAIKREQMTQIAVIELRKLVATK